MNYYWYFERFQALLIGFHFQLRDLIQSNIFKFRGFKTLYILRLSAVMILKKLRLLCILGPHACTGVLESIITLKTACGFIAIAI